MKRYILFLFALFSYLTTTLFAFPTVDFSLNPIASNLIPYNGILYTRTGSLSLSGNVGPSVQLIEFSGTTLTWAMLYRTGTTLAKINSFFPSNNSLTGGTYTISAFEGSGLALWSEQLIVDKITPRAQKIKYFDLDHNGKIDQLTVDFDEPIFGTPILPYSTGMTVYTRRGGLMASGVTTNLDFSDHITSASLVWNTITLGLQEGDMIKNNLSINTSAGSSNYSDLKVGFFAQANITDIAGNTMNSISNVVSTSKFPNSSTGVFNATTSIDFIDTGYLYGSNFSGALTVQKIDSRNKTGLLFLSGMILTTTADSFLGDGNTLQMNSGSKLVGNNSMLSIGSESHILSTTWAILFGKEGFSSAFRTLSGDVLSSVSTLTESGIRYTYNGNLIGSGISLAVDYMDGNDTLPLFSGALSGTSSLIPLPHNLSGGNLRATVSRAFGAGESSSFSWITLIFDALTESSVTFAASIVSTGSISDITKHEAKLSGAIFRPNIPGNIYYGTGELSSTGRVQNSLFSFSGLLAGNTYLYRLGLVPFLGWDEILSDTGSFTTLPAAIPPPPVSIAFQNTTYLIDQNPLLNEFTCDTTHTDCKINFNLESSFRAGYNPADYFCELDFDLDYESGEEYKCNPNTVTFPRGHDYTLHLRIIHTPEVSLFTERTILIHSPSLGGPASSTGTTSTGSTSSGSTTETGSTSTGTITPPIITPPPVINYGGGTTSSSLVVLSVPLSILDPIIIVQSWLDSNNHCNKTDCTVNLEYKPLGPKESCHWDFSGWSYATGTEDKCNPGYIHYPLGQFSITLRVFEQWNISNYREKILHLSNNAPISIIQTQAKVTSENHLPVAIIKLQWALAKSKIEQGNSVQCLWVDECSINLSWEESYDADDDKLTYFWNFWNGQTSDKSNPSAIKYTTWEYTVILRVTEKRGYSSEATFHISVLGKWGKTVVSTKLIDPNTSTLRITGVSANPLGTDWVSEWVEITNSLWTDISLADCRLDDDLIKGSKPYHFPDTALIAANSTKRFYKLQTLLNFNNTGDSANLSCGDKLMSTLAWDYSVPEGFVVSSRGWPYSGKVRTKVLRVIDGDTIVIELYGKQEKVRLIGVDTPETVDPRKSVQYYGKEASNYTRSQLEWKEVELEFDFNPRDKYDRLLAYVWIDGKNFDSELIRLGYGRAYLRFPFRYFKEFEKIGREAEKNKLWLWADPLVKKLLDADAKEDTKALKEQLRKDDDAILDDLVEIEKNTDQDHDKMDMEIIDRLFDFKNETSTRKQKTLKIGKTPKEMKLEDIHISLQWALSKNRKFSSNTFICSTKKTCSVNLTAGKTRKNTVYFWSFGPGKTFYWSNPGAIAFPRGKYIVTLKLLDTETFDTREESFHIWVKKLVSTKKPKKPKTPSQKPVKPLAIRGQDYSSPQGFSLHSLSPMQTALLSGAMALLFFSGVFLLISKKKILV